MELREKFEIAMTTQNPSLLAQLSEDLENTVRTAVAENEHTPVEVLTVLAWDKSLLVRQAVAGNKTTSEEMLTVLVKDESVRLRGLAAHNPNTPPDALARLAADANSDIREFVSLHENTPVETLACLLFDEDTFVRQSAAMNPVLAAALNTHPITVADEFLSQTPVSTIFKNQAPADFVITADILLTAARDWFVLSEDDFKKVLEAVTEDGLEIGITVGLFGEPMK